MINMLIQTFFLYFRLLLYPLLAYSMIIFAFSGEEGGKAKSTRLHIFMAGMFLMLWSTSIVAYLSPNIMVTFDNYGLLPFLTGLFIYIWVQIIKHNKDWLKKVKGE